MARTPTERNRGQWKRQLTLAWTGVSWIGLLWASECVRLLLATMGFADSDGQQSDTSVLFPLMQLNSTREAIFFDSLTFKLLLTHNALDIDSVCRQVCEKVKEISVDRMSLPTRSVLLALEIGSQSYCIYWCSAILRLSSLVLSRPRTVTSGLMASQPVSQLASL